MLPVARQVRKVSPQPRGTPSMRIAPSTLPRCHVWANDSRSLGSMTKLPNQHHRCNPRMRDDEWPEQLSCIASREGTAALHFSGSSSSVRSLVQEHAVFKWALAHMAVPARSPISSARASSWRGRGRNRAPRFKSRTLVACTLCAFSRALLTYGIMCCNLTKGILSRYSHKVCFIVF